MKIYKACNDNVFIEIKEQKDFKHGEIIMQEADAFKTITGIVIAADLNDTRVAQTNINIGDKILIHKTAVISENIGVNTISYIKAASILAIVE